MELFQFFDRLKETVLDNLRAFGNVPQNLIDCTNKQDNMNTLKFRIKIAVIAGNLDKFQKKIK